MDSSPTGPVARSYLNWKTGFKTKNQAKLNHNRQFYLGLYSYLENNRLNNETGLAWTAEVHNRCRRLICHSNRHLARTVERASRFGERSNDGFIYIYDFSNTPHQAGQNHLNVTTTVGYV
jgi:hypothetical protein